VFEGAAVGAREFGPFAEVLDVAVGAALFAGRDHAFDRRRADVLDDADAKTYNNTDKDESRERLSPGGLRGLQIR